MLCVAAPGVRAGCTRDVGPCAGPSATSSPPAWAETGTTRDRTDRTASSADRTEDTTDTIQASTSGRAREVTEGDGAVWVAGGAARQPVRPVPSLSRLRLSLMEPRARTRLRSNPQNKLTLKMSSLFHALLFPKTN